MADAPLGMTGPSEANDAPASGVRSAPSNSASGSASGTDSANWMTSDPLDDVAGSDWDAVVRGDATGPISTTPNSTNGTGTNRTNSTSTKAATPSPARTGTARPAPAPGPAPSAGKSQRPAVPAGPTRPSAGARTTAQPPGGPVQPPKLSRRARRRLRRHQRVPLWRGRILPKTVLGMAFTMLVSGLAMASSGVLLFMNYRYRQDQSDTLVRSFDARTRQATRAIQAEGTNARAQIQQELEPLRKLAATAETLTTVLSKAQPSVFTVRTFDVNGAPAIGTAFVVASDDQKSFLLTSYGVVKAATIRPGPVVMIRKGSDEIEAKLWTWQEDRDLALLIVDRGSLPRLDWAVADAARLGDQVFAVSGLGAANASITQGFIADVSTTGLQHSAPLGTAFQGGPLLNAQGQVVAMASRTYAPLGFVSDGVFFAPPVRAACDKVLKCPNGQVSAAGDQR